MSEQNAAITAKLPVKTSTNRQALDDATPAEPPEPSEHLPRARQMPAEYWASRTLWLLVTVTCLWDIAVTFDQYFALSRRLLNAALAH